jgi:hypothetical protein
MLPITPRPTDLISESSTTQTDEPHSPRTTVSSIISAQVIIYEPLTRANVERNPDQNYEVGWKRYGFAAPFSQKVTVYPLTQVERGDVKVV